VPLDQCGDDSNIAGERRPRFPAGRSLGGYQSIAAQQISGHKTRSVFDRYHTVSDTDRRESAERQATYVTRETVTIEDRGRIPESAACKVNPCIS
jgi:hypothetical protein